MGGALALSGYEGSAGFIAHSPLDVLRRRSREEAPEQLAIHTSKVATTGA